MNGRKSVRDGANSPPAKISRPSARGSLPRERLYQSLENNDKPVIWVESPAGSGKTALVSSYMNERQCSCLWYQVDAGDVDLATFFFYMGRAAEGFTSHETELLPLLTPEYIHGIPVFTRRYFEQLFHKPGAPDVIVFDNFQDVPSESGFHEMMSHALEAVPAGTTVIILSRSGPPPQLSRLRANNRMYYLGWRDLQFTIEESRDLLTLHTGKEISDRELEIIHATIDGWAAGYILLLERFHTEGVLTKDLQHLNTSTFFDYFAIQLFNKTDLRTQHFLLATSQLPAVTSSLAQELTGFDEAEQLLEHLVRQNYFTQKHVRTETVYQYHALFRTFLLAYAKGHFSAEQLLAIKQKAMQLLLAAGKKEDALPLFLETADWSTSISIILEKAPELIAQGRYKTLEGWLAALPASLVSETPWLSYWNGICLLMLNPLQARRYFERAFALFNEQNNATGSYLSWAAIILTFVYAWGDFKPVAERWIAEFYTLTRRHPFPPSPEIELQIISGIFNALFWARPQHPDLPTWAMRLHHLLLDSAHASSHIAFGVNLVQYHIMLGDFAKAPILVEALRPAKNNPVNELLATEWWFGMQAMHAWISSDHDACIAAVTKGLALSENTGAYQIAPALLAQGVFSALSHGDLAMAQDYLSKIMDVLTPRLLDKVAFHHISQLMAWYQGDVHRAVEHGEAALRISEHSCCRFTETICRVDLAITLFDARHVDEAVRQINLALTQAIGLNHLEFLCRLFQAWFALQQTDLAQGIAWLRESLALGAAQNYVNFHRWRPQMMARICAIALEHNIETDYVLQLITARRLAAPADDSLALDMWPWPLKIRTLGGFRVERNGIPLCFTGKVQRQPLALLKLLIAHGKSPIAEARIADILWPDAEGDVARVNLRSTIHRLRKLIGPEALRTENGHLNLDAGVCWVDVWALEQLLDAKSVPDEPQTIVKNNARLFALYVGAFLEGDATPEILLMRERLRHRMLRHVLAAGEALNRAHAWRESLALYERAISIDPWAESLYRGLMYCHHALGEPAEVQRSYERCRIALKTRFGLEPSAETAELLNPVG